MTGTELSPHSTPYGVAVDCVNIASNLITLNFNYGSANQNNGNIVGQTIGASSDDVWQQYYTYDGTNRLAMASENAAITGSSCPTGAVWCRQYGYDHFGNRWIAASPGHTLHMATPTAQSAVSLATNRLTSGTYDAAGNLTAQPYITTGGGSMAYDANNKLTSFTATGVSVGTKYDAGGRRVRKIHNTKTTIWVYDAFGNLAAEYTTETQTTPVGTYYRTTDHLGSTRLVTDDLGRVRQRHDFFPFGEQIPASASFGNRQDVIDGGFATYNASLSVRQQFTGQQRDEETGLDYFWARNFSGPLGRFLSVDPEGAGAQTGEPQSWNGYAYVNNSPLGSIDPDGRVTVNCSNAPELCSIPYWPYRYTPQTNPMMHHPENMLCYLYGESYCATIEEELATHSYNNEGPKSPAEVTPESLFEGWDELNGPLQAGFGRPIALAVQASILPILSQAPATARVLGGNTIRWMTNFASTDQLKAIWKGIGEAKKIDAFFIQYGKGLEGAQRLLDALNKGTIKTVEGVSRGGAEIYRALARDYVANMDPVKYEVGVAVQATRAQIIEKAAELGLLK